MAESLWPTASADSSHTRWSNAPENASATAMYPNTAATSRHVTTAGNSTPYAHAPSPQDAWTAPEPSKSTTLSNTPTTSLQLLTVMFSNGSMTGRKQGSMPSSNSPPQNPLRLQLKPPLINSIPDLASFETIILSLKDITISLDLVKTQAASATSVTASKSSGSSTIIRATSHPITSARPITRKKNITRFYR